MKKFWNAIKDYVIIIVVVVLIRTFLVTPALVDGDSMKDTLHDKDCLFMLNASFKKPSYSDVVVLNCVGVKNCDSFIVKRVVAIEGDVVDIKQGRVYVNNNVIDEPYAVGITQPGYVYSYPITVPKGYIFYLGDNREHSGDARHFGILPRDRVIGYVPCLVFPLRRFKIF